MEDMLNQLVAASTAASAENQQGLAQLRHDLANIHARTQSLEQSPASLGAIITGFGKRCGSATCRSRSRCSSPFAPRA